MEFGFNCFPMQRHFHITRLLDYRHYSNRCAELKPNPKLKPKPTVNGDIKHYRL